MPKRTRKTTKPRKRVAPKLGQEQNAVPAVGASVPTDPFTPANDDSKPEAVASPEAEGGAPAGAEDTGWTDGVFSPDGGQVDDQGDDDFNDDDDFGDDPDDTEGGDRDGRVTGAPDGGAGKLAPTSRLVSLSAEGLAKAMTGVYRGLVRSTGAPDLDDAERREIQRGFTVYFKSRKTGDVPPEVALAVALIGPLTVRPQVTESITTKLGKVWDLGVGWWRRWRSRKEGDE